MDHLSIPPENVTPQQLYTMMVELHSQVQSLSEKQDTLREEVAAMAKAFHAAHAVIRVVKWLAAIGAAFATIYGVLKGTR